MRPIRDNSPYARLLECLNMPFATFGRRATVMTVADLLDLPPARITDSLRLSNRGDQLNTAVLYRAGLLGISMNYLIYGQGEPFMAGWQQGRTEASLPIRTAEQAGQGAAKTENSKATTGRRDSPGGR